MAESVLGAVVAQLRNYTNRLSSRRGQDSVANQRAQVKAAATALAAARENVTTYLAQHPRVSRTDPNYVSLTAAENNAVAQLKQANTALSQVSGTSNADAWSLEVIDPPSQASATALRKSKIAEVILGGVLGGVLVSFLAIVILTPAKKEVWEDELPIGGPFVPGVPPADPFRAGSPAVPTASSGSTPAPTAVGARLSFGDRRFQFRSPPPPPEEQ